EFSRRDIIETYKLDQDRVMITPAAAPNHFAPVKNETELRNIRERYGIKPNYLLALGSIQPRKNLTRLIEAYASLQRERAAENLPQLVIAGKRGWLDEKIYLAANRQSQNESIKLIGYVPDKDLPALYSGATCFVYPSFF